MITPLPNLFFIHQLIKNREETYASSLALRPTICHEMFFDAAQDESQKCLATDFSKYPLSSSNIFLN